VRISEGSHEIDRRGLRDSGRTRDAQRDTRPLASDRRSSGASIPEEELRKDYPNLTPEMMGSARIYVQERPQRGCPREPGWRSTKPLSSHYVWRA
jgi:hypothetical protein